MSPLRRRAAERLRRRCRPTPSSELSLLQRELGRARQKIATLDRIDPGTGPRALPVLPRNAAARSCDGAPRPALRDAARVRDRRVRRLSANVRRQSCRFLPTDDRRADHARVASRGRSVRALRRLDVGCGGRRPACRRDPAVGRADRGERARSSSCTTRAAKSSRYVDDARDRHRLPAGRARRSRARIARALADARGNDAPARAVLA